LTKGLDIDAYEARKRAYAREVHTDTAREGSVLFYRLDVWHRGTPVHRDQVRGVHNLVWKRPDALTMLASGQWNPGMCRKLYYGWLENVVSKLSTPQLLAIGFPPATSPYWNARTINEVQRRYPGIDLGYAVTSRL
jgi:hypothetical protein